MAVWYWKETRAYLVQPWLLYLLLVVGFWWHAVMEACLVIHRRGWLEAGSSFFNVEDAPTAGTMPPSGTLLHATLRGLDGIDPLSDEEFGVQGVAGLRLIRKVEECGFKPVVHRTCPPDALEFDPDPDANFLQNIVEGVLQYSASMSLSIAYQVAWEIWRYGSGIIGTVLFCALFGDISADEELFGNLWTGGFPRWPRLPECKETWSNITDWVERTEYSEQGRYGRLASEEFIAKGVKAGDMHISDIFLTELQPAVLRFSDGGCKLGDRLAEPGCVEVPEALEYDVHPDFWYDVVSGYFVEVGKERDSIMTRLSVYAEAPRCEAGDLRVHFELQNVSDDTPLTFVGQMESSVLQPLSSATAGSYGLSTNYDNFFFGREGHWSLMHSLDFRHYPVAVSTWWSRILLFLVILATSYRARRMWVPYCMASQQQTKVAVEDAAEKKTGAEATGKDSSEAVAGSAQHDADNDNEADDDDDDDEEEEVIRPSNRMRLLKSWGDDELLQGVSSGAMALAALPPCWFYMVYQASVWSALYGMGPWQVSLLSTSLVLFIIYKQTKTLLTYGLDAVVRQSREFFTEVLTELPENEEADTTKGMKEALVGGKEQSAVVASSDAPQRRVNKLWVITSRTIGTIIALSFFGMAFIDMFESGRGVPERTAPWETLHRTKLRYVGVVMALGALVTLGETHWLFVYDKEETDADYEPNWMSADNAWNDPVDKDNAHEFRPELLRKEGKGKASNEDIELCRQS